MQGKFIRLCLNRDGKRAGYFVLRPTADESAWLVTSRVTEEGEDTQPLTGTDPQAGVVALFDRIVDHYRDIDAKYEYELEAAPTLVPEHRHGFRNFRARFVGRLRAGQAHNRRLAERSLVGVMERIVASGWPVIPVPKLSWQS